MSLAHFKPFLRSLLEDYVAKAEQREHTESQTFLVTQPLDFTGTGYPDSAGFPARGEKPEPPSRIVTSVELSSPPRSSAPEPSPSSTLEAPEVAKAAEVPHIPSPPAPAPKPSIQACPIPAPETRRRSPPPLAKAEPRVSRDSPSAKPGPKRSLSAKGNTNSGNTPRKASTSPSAAPRSSNKPAPSVQKDSFHDAFFQLSPDLLELLSEEELADGSSAPSSPSIFRSAREALQRMRELCQELGDSCFVDPDFGPTVKDPTGRKSLIPVDAVLPAEAFQQFPGHDQVSWLRAHEVWPKGHHFCGELAEVRPGVFGDAWFLGALCSLSLSEMELFGHPSGYEEPLGVYPRVFWDPEFRRRGLYCFRFSSQGQWSYVVVDDCLPFHRKTSKPLFSYAVGLDTLPHLWIALIEKAFAKLHGAYFSLWLGFVDDALEDLTSWPTEKLQVSKFTKGNDGKRKDPGEFWSTLLEHNASMICLRADAGDGTDKSDMVHVDPQSIHLDAREVGSFCTGIFRNWAYPILCLRACDLGDSDGLDQPPAPPVRFIRLRSFMGGWHGPWGDQDLNLGFG